MPQGGWVNLGGPGWFHDVVDLEVTLNCDRKIPMRNYLFIDECKLFESKDKITGTIKIKGGKIWHYGLKLRLDQSISFYESFRSVELPSIEIDLESEGYLTEDKEIPFSIDLSKNVFSDTYSGENFALRHVLVTTLTRPWYTFDVSDYQNIAIQNVGPLPSEEGGQEFVVPPLVNEMGEIVEEAPPKSHVLDIGDCGGAAKLDYGGWNFTLEDVIDGTIVFSGLTESITTIDVLLMKIEQGDDESNESIVHELSVLAPKFAAEDAAKIEESDVDVPKAVGEPITGDVQIPVKLELKDLDITPTYIHAGNKEGDADDLINVRYYLRLRLANSSGGLFWNTNEVFFFRKALSGMIQIDV